MSDLLGFAPAYTAPCHVPVVIPVFNPALPLSSRSQRTIAEGWPWLIGEEWPISSEPPRRICRIWESPRLDQRFSDLVRRIGPIDSPALQPAGCGAIKRPARQVALLICVSEYSCYEGYRDLPAVEKDAAAMFEAFLQLGYVVWIVKNGSSADICRTLWNGLRSLEGTEGSVAVVYLAGHDFAVPLQRCFDQCLHQTCRLGAQRLTLVFFVDVCRNSCAAEDLVRLADCADCRHLHICLMFGAACGTYAQEEEEGGVFTQALIKSLKSSTPLGLSDIFINVSRDVAAASPSRHPQIPGMYTCGDITSLQFTKPAAGGDLSVVRRPSKVCFD